MRRRAAPLAAIAALALLAGCAPANGTRITRSDQRPVADGPSGGSGGSGGPDGDRVAWAPCEEYEAPFECATLGVPLDHDDPDGAEISVALIRLPTQDSSSRIGSLIVNPGGPGGSGIALAYREGANFPPEVLERFDIVGFDPRGVGESTPVQCPATFDPVNDSYDDCIEPNIDLLPFLGTPNVARDMDLVRAAVGDEQITYLGFSYGSALGAVYADLFPQRIRAMVLDGAIDPDAGLSNTSVGGSDFYADQDFEGAVEAFERLCDASVECDAGPSSTQLVERVEGVIRDLPTDFFPGGGLSPGDLDDLLVNAMYSSFDWSTLAIALVDADNGDGSTLAALSNWYLEGYPVDEDAPFADDFANIAIRCADFVDRSRDSYECENFPTSAAPLPVITAVDTPSPIVVIGTRDDPATPAFYSPLMADALGDAVAIEWEGAGHTATLTSRCITDLVARYLVTTIPPDDGQTCPFVTGATTLEQTADIVFAEPESEYSVAAVEAVLLGTGQSESTASCVAPQFVRHGTERLVVHALLGVESPELIALRTSLELRCAQPR